MVRPIEWTEAALARIQENVPLSSKLIEKIMCSVAAPYRSTAASDSLTRGSRAHTVIAATTEKPE